VARQQCSRRLGRGYNIDVDYTTGTCSFHCVPVNEVYASGDPLNMFSSTCSGLIGYFAYSPVNSADHFTSTHLIRLNRACESKSASFRRSLTCQEMGHALGLDHAAATSSCMFQDPSRAATTPRQHDYDVVNAIYNKYDHPS
jgi:hypothetical protein